MAGAFADRQSAALADAPSQLTTLPVAAVGLVAGDVTASPRCAAHRRDATSPATSSDEPAVDLPGLRELVDELDGAGNGWS